MVCGQHVYDALAQSVFSVCGVSIADPDAGEVGSSEGAFGICFSFGVEPTPVGPNMELHSELDEQADVASVSSFGCDGLSCDV